MILAKYRIEIISILFLCFILLGTALPVFAQEAIEEPAEVVAKIAPPTISPITEKVAIMQHRGRPKKEGEVHRVTEWRRKKELQGVLL